MNYFTEKNNKVYLSGVVVGDAEFSHEVYGEGFYEMKVSVPRLSGQEDILPVTVSERLIADKNCRRAVPSTRWDSSEATISSWTERASSC